MCTIFTADKAFYEKIGKRDIFLHIRSDASYNRDGFNLILYGDTPTFLQTFDLNAVFSLLETISWKRFFLHARASTTSQNGLFGCHGWEGGGYYVQHNGILRKPSRDYRVDSMYIADSIDKFGIEKTIEYLLREETFANVFLIESTFKEYIVIRSSSGSLHTDFKGNFSSNPIGDINISVEKHTYEKIKLEEEKNWFTKLASFVF